MGYLWYDLKSLKSGQIVEIEIGTAVNVKLMSYDYFTKLVGMGFHIVSLVGLRQNPHVMLKCHLMARGFSYLI